MKKIKVGEKTTILVALLVFLSTCGKIVTKLFTPTATIIEKVLIPVLLIALGYLFYNYIKVAKSKQSKYRKYMSK